MSKLTSELRPEILALGDRFSAAYMSIQDTIAKFGHITYKDEKSFANADGAIDFIRNSSIDMLIMPNPYGNERRMWIYKKLKTLNFPIIVFDRGGLPNSWFFDVGFNADSPSYHPLKWDKPLSTEQITAVTEYIKQVKYEIKPLEAQGERQGGVALKKKLGIENKRVLFVPLQRPSDTTIKFFSNPIEGFDAFIKVVIETIQRTATTLNDWTIVVKKHPLETSRPEHSFISYVDDNTHVYDLIEACDAVLLINSGVGLLASLWNKPVLHAGTVYYGHPQLNRQIITADDVEHALNNLPTVDTIVRDRFIHYLWTQVYSFGHFETELVQQKDNAYRNITRHIDFYDLKVPEKKNVFFLFPQ